MRFLGFFSAESVYLYLAFIFEGLADLGCASSWETLLANVVEAKERRPQSRCKASLTLADHCSVVRLT